MAKYLHITVDNSRQAICGVVTEAVYFGFWGGATCPRCRAIALKHPDWMVHAADRPPLTTEEVKHSFEVVDQQREEREKDKK